MNRWILNTIQDSDLRLRKKLLKSNPLLLVVYFTTLTAEKSFTRQLPALFDNYVLTPAVTTAVYKQDTTARPLDPAAKK